MTDYAGAQWVPNNNFFPARDGQKPRYLIIHGTAGDTSAVGIANYFVTTQGTNNPVTSHYIIGTAGEVVQTVLESNGAWANGALTAGHASFWDKYPGVNPNNLTISIECCKASLDNSDTLTAPQQASLLKLVNDICTRNGIPKKAADASGGITGHYSLDPVNRSNCPGTLNWNALWTYLSAPTSTPTPPQGGTTVGIPQGWKDNGTVLTAPNGIPITDGFRSYILTHAWDAANIPISAAQGLTPLELSNPGLGGGTRQTFRWSALEWTSKNGTYEAWIGQELTTVLNLLHTTQASLSKLQTDYNNVVDEKNGLVSELATLKAQTPADEVLKAAVASALQPATAALTAIETLIK
jgi:N-acetyl-anhydromuramyl-L-alanine amidase AmpD